ncbi:MAG: glutamate formimidoyltransferase [bacterium]
MQIETVPNLSEGRNIKLINKIHQKLKQIKNIQIKDIHYDYDHNRSVFTIVGNLSSVFESIFVITDQVIDNLDINLHQGVHPRAGILDVIPFIPIKGISYKQLISKVEKFAHKFFERYKIPVYLYSLSSKRLQTQKLSYIRNKGFEFIKKLTFQDKDLLPDIYQDSIFHPTMGVSFIGVRYPLIAFNFNFKIPPNNSQYKDHLLQKVKQIAKTIRESSGGIKNVQALAFFLPSQNIVQLSTNILEAHKTNFLKVYHIITQLIQQNNLKLHNTELVGCIPNKIVEKIIKQQLKLSRFHINNVIQID